LNTIADSAVDEYRERGYWISPRVFNDEYIAVLRHEVDRLFELDWDRDIYPSYRDVDWDVNSTVLRRVVNGWWLNDTIRSCVTSPLLGYAASRFMETDEVRLWQDQIVVKPGLGNSDQSRIEGNIGWHQDYAHFVCATTADFCTAWIALQDTDLSNGCMRTIVGSHKWGLQPTSNTYHEKDLDKLKTKFLENGREWLEEACVMKLGEISFHHGLCFHGSGPNITSEPRYSIIVHMMPGGTAYRGRTRFHPNIQFLGPNAKPGDLFDGPYFPVVWSANTSSVEMTS
jgi:ectoine hydroxylase-related dioxygenase (phytanoyl-CoA dioxygenase family)